MDSRPLTKADNFQYQIHHMDRFEGNSYHFYSSQMSLSPM